MFNKEGLNAVSFDLDETIYPSVPEINDRIRNKMSERILDKIPDLGDLEGARDFFEKRYSQLQSGRKVIISAGYSPDEASRIADEAVSQADILDLLKANPTTARLLRKISEVYFTSLITSSPKEIALRKLEVLGISPTFFHEKVYGDSGFGPKQEGEPFRYIIKSSGIPAGNHAYVGNSAKSDIIPAKKEGMRTIGVWSNIPEADTSIENINDLERLLL